MRNYKRKTDRATVPPSVLETAANKVLENPNSKGCTIRNVAKTHGISISTLSRHIKKIKSMPVRLPPSDMPIGRRIFSPAQEKVICDFVVDANENSSGATSSEIRRLAFQLAVKYNLKYPDSWIKNSSAGPDWLLNFLKRHPNLQIRRGNTKTIAKALADAVAHRNALSGDDNSKQQPLSSMGISRNCTVASTSERKSDDKRSNNCGLQFGSNLGAEALQLLPSMSSKTEIIPEVTNLLPDSLKPMVSALSNILSNPQTLYDLLGSAILNKEQNNGVDIDIHKLRNQLRQGSSEGEWIGPQPAPDMKKEESECDSEEIYRNAIVAGVKEEEVEMNYEFDENTSESFYDVNGCLDIGEDVKHLCRLCASFVPPDTRIWIHRVATKEMINKLLPQKYQIKERNGLPEIICESCFETVKMCSAAMNKFKNVGILWETLLEKRKNQTREPET